MAGSLITFPKFNPPAKKLRITGYKDGELTLDIELNGNQKDLAIELDLYNAIALQISYGPGHWQTYCVNEDLVKLATPLATEETIKTEEKVVKEETEKVVKEEKVDLVQPKKKP